MVKPLLIFALLGLGTMGCGAAGGSHGGGDNLPSTQSHPYDVDEDFQLSRSGTDLRSPSLLVGEEGSTWVYLVETKDDVSIASRIRLDPDATDLNESLREELLLEGTPWEHSPPFQLEIHPLGERYLAVFSEPSVQGIQFAESDDGIQWNLDGTRAPILGPEGLPRAFSSHLSEQRLKIWMVTEDGKSLLYGQENETGSDWEWKDVERPAGDREGQSTPGLWEQDGISSCHVMTQITETGRTLYRMWYGGIREAASGILDGGIGFAGSWDGELWVASPDGSTVYNAGFGEKDPFLWEAKGRTHLYYSRFWKKEGNNRHVIGRASLEAP
jgi:hypothetical protein